MSERLGNYEKEQPHEREVTQESLRPQEQLKHTPEINTPSPEQSATVETIREEVEQEAISREATPLPPAHTTENSPMITGSISPALAAMTQHRLLKHIRAHLSAPDRTLSRVIHQPVVDQLSEFGSKTVARPSSLIGGGVCTFIGSLLFLYIAKEYGYTYNFFLFALLFVAGAALGLFLEIIWSVIKRTKSR